MAMAPQQKQTPGKGVKWDGMAYTGTFDRHRSILPLFFCKSARQFTAMLLKNIWVASVLNNNRLKQVTQPVKLVWQ